MKICVESKRWIRNILYEVFNLPGNRITLKRLPTRFVEQKFQNGPCFVLERLVSGDIK